jgi:uncharacterized protein YbbC (DUF1343 family)
MKLGLEVIAENPEVSKSFGVFSLVSNQASVNQALEPSWSIFNRECTGRMVSLMGPQHGFESTVQDNMIETDHAIHLPTNLPVYSLYSETREPTKKMVEGLDTIVIDLQISGTRIYTYKYTIAACLRAAKKYGKKVVILDRPNPIGGTVVEGRVLDLAARSFVGEFQIPMRHGLTPGEAALFFNQEINAELEVVWMEGWNPSHLWDSLGRPWVLTSPNLPTAESSFVYPGMVLFEGTNISEGRGTARPFQLIGAPAIKDGRHLKDLTLSLLGESPEGVFLRPTTFQPTFHKWQGEVCHGLDIIVTEPAKIRSFELALALIRASIELMGSDFQWAQPPYEYNDTELPINLLIGHLQADKQFTGDSFSISDDFWREGQDTYLAGVQRFLHYDRKLSLN